MGIYPAISEQPLPPDMMALLRQLESGQTSEPI